MDIKNKKIKAGAVLGAASTVGLIGVGLTLGYVCPFCVLGLAASGGLITVGVAEEFQKKGRKG